MERYEETHLDASLLLSAQAGNLPNWEAGFPSQ